MIIMKFFILPLILLCQICLAQSSLKSQLQMVVSKSILPKNTKIIEVFQKESEIVLTLDVSPQFLKYDFNEEVLEQVSHDLDMTLFEIAPDVKKIHLAVMRDGKKVALSNFLKIEKTPIKEPAHEESLNKKRVHNKGSISGALSDKVLFISQAHGWIDYNDSREWATQRGINNDIVEDFVNSEATNQYLLEYLRNAGAKIFTVRELDMNNNMVIVDNEDGLAHASNGTYEEVGASNLFNNSSANGFKNFQAPYANLTDPFRSNGGSDRVITTALSETARAVWSPVIPEDGYYHVYVSYSGVGNRPTDAKYIVHHGGLETVVYVNQEVHRYVWNDIGEFYFKAGGNDFVALSNESAESGTTVSADAVRFGGGMGDVKGNYHPVISTHPRWEEGARSYVQFQGANSSIYTVGDVGARSKFAAWEHYSVEDSVYVSWHSNAFNGSARGTNTYIYSSNPPDGTYDTTQAVAGSAQLQTAIHSEIINDIHQAWDSNWQDRGKRSAYFGEINPARNNEMPSVLIEMAFHDNVDDANALRNPQFRKLVARSVYQGIVKYFAQRDSLSINLVPDEITHFAVKSVQNGQIHLSWQAPLTDGNDIGGGAASSYVVYQSTDGYNFDDGSQTNDLFYDVTNLAAGTVYYFKVKAKNAGGLSLASETLGARVRYANENRVLVVNGFDRLNSGQLISMNMPDIGGFVDRMFLRQMNAFNYTIQHGDAINEAGVGFDSIANELIEDNSFSLNANDYQVVLWILGEESSLGSTLTAAEQNQLTSYLNAGGKLFISGAEIAWDLDNLGSSADKNFYHNVLMTQYTADDANTYQASGQVASPFATLGTLNFDDGSHGTYQVEFPDVIAPLNSAATCLQYLGAQSACTYVDTGTYQVIHLGFPFETIYPKSKRNDLMAQSMDYFAIPYFSDLIFANGFE